MRSLRSLVPVLFAGALLAAPVLSAKFRDDFDAATITRDPAGLADWDFFTGDGAATVDLRPRDGVAELRVDATRDRRGIWWALIKRDITATLDLAQLAQPGTELRVEARVRTTSPCKRVNLHVNTRRTTDFHGNLLEFDLPEAGVWYTISMTTRDFDARPGDRVYAQLALMDWGLGCYGVDLDHYQVEVVDAAQTPPDLGGGVPYHPAQPKPESFAQRLAVAQAATIDRAEPDANLADWSVVEPEGATTRGLVAVNGTLCTLLRWDFAAWAGRAPAPGPALLALTTQSVQRRAERTKDFGMVRVVEILAGDPQWDGRTVTSDSLRQGRPYEEVFNTQMIIDTELADRPGACTYVTLSEAVMGRLLSGRTKGIVILPLGSISATFVGAAGAAAPTLLFNVQ